MAKKQKKFTTKDYMRVYNNNSDYSLYDDFEYDYEYNNRKMTRKRKVVEND